jgi:hypothetical protein
MAGRFGSCRAKTAWTTKEGKMNIRTFIKKHNVRVAACVAVDSNPKDYLDIWDLPN